MSPAPAGRREGKELLWGCLQITLFNRNALYNPPVTSEIKAEGRHRCLKMQQEEVEFSGKATEGRMSAPGISSPSSEAARGGAAMRHSWGSPPKIAKKQSLGMPRHRLRLTWGLPARGFRAGSRWDLFPHSPPAPLGCRCGFGVTHKEGVGLVASRQAGCSSPPNLLPCRKRAPISSEIPQIEADPSGRAPCDAWPLWGAPKALGWPRGCCGIPAPSAARG